MEAFYGDFITAVKYFHGDKETNPKFYHLEQVNNQMFVQSWLEIYFSTRVILYAEKSIWTAPITNFDVHTAQAKHRYK